MKVLVTGVKGQLGFDVCKELDKRNIENKGIDRDDCDITDEQAVLSYLDNTACLKMIWNFTLFFEFK